SRGGLEDGVLSNLVTATKVDRHCLCSSSSSSSSSSSEIRVQTVIRTAGCVRAVDLRDLLKTGDIDNLWLKSCMLSLRKKVCRAVCDLARMLPLISRAPHQVREV